MATHRRRRRWGGLGLTLGACLVLDAAGSARATGFFINQQSVPGLGRAFAGSVAAAEDPSTIFYNPAGLPRLLGAESNGIGFVASAGAHLIIPRSELTDQGATAATPSTLGAPFAYPGEDARNPGEVTLVPNLFAGQRLYQGQLAVGLGVSTPFGLAGEYDRDWFGRYDSIESELITINIGPVVAVRLNDFLSVGGGLDVQYADSTLSLAIPDPLAPGGPSPATDGLFRATGNDWSVGFNAGALLEVPGSGLRFGVHYRSQMEHTIEGTATVSGLTGALAPLNERVGASARSRLPAFLSTGLAYVLIDDAEVGDRLTVYGDFTYFWWSVAEEARIEFVDDRDPVVRPTNFRDTFAAGIGIDYRWSEHLTLRTGFRFDRTPTVDAFRDTTFVDANRYWIAAGASYQVFGWLTVDVGVTHVFEDDTAVDVEREFFEGTPLASTVNVRADVRSSVTTVAANTRVRF
jgi:long-chain fatty acid transport protein